MKINPVTSVALLSALTCAALCVQGESLDRIAVTVGTHVIAESDLILELRVDAFLDGKTAILDGASKHKAAERLVDQYLILEDAALSRAQLPDETAVAKLLEPIKARYGASKENDGEYQAALEQAGISEEDLKEHLLTGLRLARYAETRFRSGIEISDEDLRKYYADLIKDKGGEAGQTKADAPAFATPDFETSKGQLEQLLTNQRVMEAMDAWLKMTRQGTKIVYREAAFE